MDGFDWFISWPKCRSKGRLKCRSECGRKVGRKVGRNVGQNVGWKVGRKGRPKCRSDCGPNGRLKGRSKGPRKRQRSRPNMVKLVDECYGYLELSRGWVLNGMQVMSVWLTAGWHRFGSLVRILSMQPIILQNRIFEEE